MRINKTYSIKEILDGIKNIKDEKLCKYQWQDLALEIIKKFDVEPNKKSSVFKQCKEDKDLCQRVMHYCLEGSRNHIDYFFKMINIFKNNN